MSMKGEDSERRYAQIEGERDYYRRLAANRAQELAVNRKRIAELEEREAALAAHVERLNIAFCNYIASDCLPLLEDAVQAAPLESLAKRDFIKQAEALEHRADCIMAEAGYLENFRREVAGILRNDAKDKRQQAEQC